MNYGTWLDKGEGQDFDSIFPYDSLFAQHYSGEYITYPKFLIDCYYHQNYQNCRYGQACYYRHEPDTRGRQICPGFRKGVCFNRNCPLRHNYDRFFSTRCPAEARNKKCVDSHCPYTHRVTKFTSGFNCATAMKKVFRKWYDRHDMGKHSDWDRFPIFETVQVPKIEILATAPENSYSSDSEICEAIKKWTDLAQCRRSIIDRAKAEHKSRLDKEPLVSRKRSLEPSNEKDLTSNSCSDKECEIALKRKRRVLFGQGIHAIVKHCR
ncbi:hypothetical protein ACOME3_003597 [Neoechinorhynchus agilis]